MNFGQTVAVDMVMLEWSLTDDQATEIACRLAWLMVNVESIQFVFLYFKSQLIKLQMKNDTFFSFNNFEVTVANI